MLLSLGSPLNLGNIVGGIEPLWMSSEQRKTHLHVVGNTGSGKTKFLEHLIRQDILANTHTGSGLLLIDPEGQLYDNLMAWMARIGFDGPVVPIDLRRKDWIIPYNLLRQRRSTSVSVVVDAMTDAMAHVWGAANTDETPRFARWVGNLLHVLYEKRYTLAEAIHLLTDHVELRQAIVSGVKDRMVRRDWEMVNRWKPEKFDDEIASTLNRLRRFVANEHMQTIFGQPDKSLDLGEVLEEGAIVLVTLSTEGGRISDENAQVLATVLLNDLWTAAKERGEDESNRPFYVYIDEFQEFLTPTIATNLDRSRKYGLRWTLAHQFPAQLQDAGENGRRVYKSVMESARSKVVFSLATRDNLLPMAEWLFMGTIDPDQIKHEIHSTKVMEYQLRYERSYSEGMTKSKGGTQHHSESWGEGSGESNTSRDDGETDSETESQSEQYSGTSGSTDSWSESETSAETLSPMLMPIMGKELSSVQYRSIEEQFFRAMAVLFDQKQRQAVARLVDMRTPASLFTPFVSPAYMRPEDVENYAISLYEKLPLALRGPEAQARLESRSSEFVTRVIGTSKQFADETDGPVIPKRRIRTGR